MVLSCWNENVVSVSEGKFREVAGSEQMNIRKLLTVVCSFQFL